MAAPAGYSWAFWAFQSCGLNWYSMQDQCQWPSAHHPRQQTAGRLHNSRGMWCLGRKAQVAFATQRLIILVRPGSKSDRPSPDSGGGVTIKWEELGTGEHSGQGFVSSLRRRSPTELILVLQPTKRDWHSHETTSHSTTHQQNTSRFTANKWCEWCSRNLGQRIQCRRVGRVLAHTWPEVFRLQQDPRWNCQRNRLKDGSQCGHITRTDQSTNILSKRSHPDPCGFTWPDEGAGWWSAKGYWEADQRDGLEANTKAECYYPGRHCCKHRPGQFGWFEAGKRSGPRGSTNDWCAYESWFDGRGHWCRGYIGWKDHTSAARLRSCCEQRAKGYRK